jgi:hypothetical protein
MRIGNIEISDKRFKDITFKSAKKACVILGDGWRLPSEIEMVGIFDLLDYLGTDKRIGNFGNTDKAIIYWTSVGTVVDLDRGGIYGIDTIDSSASSLMVRDI